MDNGELLDLARRLAARHSVRDGSVFRLAACDPADVGPFADLARTKGGDAKSKDAKSKDAKFKDAKFKDAKFKDASFKEETRELLAAGVRLLSAMQDMLYAQDRWSVLLVFQAMDAAGKDGAIKHVMSGVNPQGCEVHSFKAPSAEELDHDFLWRCARLAPRRGSIGIFNRSYYEETLVVRVRPEYLAAQRLPVGLADDGIWESRYESIRAFERHLVRNGTVIRKFFLHVSRDEQKRRFLERIEDPSKNWKFSAGDVAERAHWDAYMRAYEDTIRATSTSDAPWSVVPADAKWYTRLVVAATIVDALAGLDLHYPRLGPREQAALEESKRRLLAEG